MDILTGENLVQHPSNNISIILEYLYGLVEAMGLVIERDVANWIANQGGWVSVCLYTVRS